MTTPFERMHQAHMALEAAKQEAADAMAALKQQFGSFEISVNVNGKTINIVIADQKSRTARLIMPIGIAVNVARYVLELAEHVQPEYLEPPHRCHLAEAKKLRPPNHVRTTPTIERLRIDLI